MLLVFALTATGLYLVEHTATKDVKRDFERDFHSELAAMHRVEDVRYAALAERCRVLMNKPRLHAALEDNALDLLYPSARDELRDLMVKDPAITREQRSGGSRQSSIGFWIGVGQCTPPTEDDGGALQPQEEAQLAVKPLPSTPQTGYL